jgi:hypothetical protein
MLSIPVFLIIALFLSNAQFIVTALNASPPGEVDLGSTAAVGLMFGSTKKLNNWLAQGVAKSYYFFLSGTGRTQQQQ